MQRLYLDSTCVSFHIDDITNNNFFLENGFVYGGVQPKLLCTFDGFETDDDVRYRFAISTQWVFRFGGRQLCNLAFVHLFGFFYPEA